MGEKIKRTRWVIVNIEARTMATGINESLRRVAIDKWLYDWRNIGIDKTWDEWRKDGWRVVKAKVEVQ
jgi:hypothetical protein